MDSSFSDDFQTCTKGSEALSLWEDEESAELRRKFQMRNLDLCWGDKRKKSLVLHQDTLKRDTRSVSVESKIFEARMNIKIIVSKGPLLVLADVFSCLYIVKNVQDKNREIWNVKLDYFKLTDVAFVGDRLLCVAENTSVIKELDLKMLADVSKMKKDRGDERNAYLCCICQKKQPLEPEGKETLCEERYTCFSCGSIQYKTYEKSKSISVINIRKKSGEKGYKKMLVKDRIYILGSLLTVFDKQSYEILYQIHNRVTDFAVVGDVLYCLTLSKDILIYKRRSLLRKVSFDDKFGYRKIFGTDVIYIVEYGGIKILSKNLGKSVEKRCCFEPCDIQEGKDYVVILGSDRKSINLLEKQSYRGVANFPKSGMSFPRITCSIFVNRTMYFCHGKFLSLITF